jgi:hypothetical protein
LFFDTSELVMSANTDDGDECFWLENTKNLGFFPLKDMVSYPFIIYNGGNQ